MKKFIVVLVLLFAATVVFGQDMGKFPAGKWLDPNWDAIWEFSGGGVKILDSKTGDLHYNFAGQMKDLKASLSGIKPVVTFYCADTEKTYSFTFNPSNNDVELNIDRVGKPKYTVTMKQQ